LAEHRGRLFPDELFADLFPSGRGRPSVPADVIATVLVLQSLEGLSDRDAVQALRTDLRWKVAAGLALDDEGFHPTVLTLWRNKLRASERPERIFDAVRAVITETGVLRGKVRRALDSTLLDDAVATQDTVTQLIAAIRRVRRLIPAAGRLELAAHDYNEPGKPRIAWDDDDARQRLTTGLVTDAQAVLDAVDGVPLDDDQAAAVGLLALVAGQDVEPGDGDGTWRIAQRTAKDRVISTVDPDRRHMHKSVSSYRDGYKAHVSVEPVTGLICAQRLTPANSADGPTGVELMADEPPKRQVLADGAYGSATSPVITTRRVCDRADSSTSTTDQSFESLRKLASGDEIVPACLNHRGHGIAPARSHPGAARPRSASLEHVRDLRVDCSRRAIIPPSAPRTAYASSRTHLRGSSVRWLRARWHCSQCRRRRR
jgi:Transposase domain (DUF772)/Transposase DDE domain